MAGKVCAWGQNGHRVVGLVAEQHLTKKARRNVLEILQGNSLAEVSVWMDEIRSDADYDYTHDWHWVSIPDSLRYEDTEKNPKGDLLWKVEELLLALEQEGLSREQEREYLKFLVHLVGDLHQPLHVGTGEDAGGNNVRVHWFSTPSNLHKVWDTDMIESKNLSFSELASFLDKPSKKKIKEWQSGSVKEWAYENMLYRDQIYRLPKDGRLGYEYLFNNFELVELRLLQAGIRLAGLLNRIYG